MVDFRCFRYTSSVTACKCANTVHILSPYPQTRGIAEARIPLSCSISRVLTAFEPWPEDRMPIRCKLGFMVNTAMGMVRRSVQKRNSTLVQPWDPQLWGSWDTWMAVV